MASLYRQLARRRKLFTIIAIGLVVTGYVKVHEWCALHPGEPLCSAPFSAEWIAELLRIIRWYLVGIVVVIGYFLVRGRRRDAAIEREGGFKAFPERYHEQIVEITGTVVYVLKDRTSEMIRRKITDATRSITGNRDAKNRYLHQRFLITSSDLAPGHNLMIHHNINSGAVPLKIGATVQVKGEYIHHLGFRRTWFGKRRLRYGRIHYTHEPRGYLRNLG